jgi:hypothetical protein
MSHQEKQEIINTIPDVEDTYETIEKGNHLMGLVRIQNIDMPTWDESISAFNKEKTKPGYRLSFRSKENKNSFVNIDVASSTFKRSNMWNLLNNMSGEQLKPNVKSSELFETMLGFQGQWFDVRVAHREGKGKYEGTFFAHIKDLQVYPAAKCPKGSALDFFGEELKEPPKKIPHQDDLEPEKDDSLDDDEIPF